MKETNDTSRFNVPGFCQKALKQISASLVALSALLAFSQTAGAALYTWNVASGNWSTPASWTPSTGVGGPLAADSVIFGVTGASSSSNTVNSVVDASFAGTVANFTNNSVSLSPFLFNVIQIPAGKTLTVTNRVLVGGLIEPTGPYLTYAFMNGGGTFKFTGANLAVENYGSASGANDYATLDLSGLTNFVFNNPVGTISIADTYTGGTRAAGNFVLAGVSNSITATNINVGTSSAAQAGPTDTLTFGAGTNIVNVANFNIANNKNPATVNFAAPGGGLRIRGVSGSDSSRANITIGNRNQTGTGTTTGNFIALGNPVDIKAATLTIGANPNTGTPGSGGDFGVGLMAFDTGVVDATNVTIASTATVNIGCARGTLTVGPNAVLNVGTGGITLLNQTVAEDASHIGVAVLNISNGVVNCNGNIAAGANVGTGAGGPGTNVINFLGGGTLSIASDCIVGTTNSPISQLNLDTNSTFKFAAPPNNLQPAVAVNTLTWPANDSTVTFVVSNLPSTATVGTIIPLVNFVTLTGGSFTAPNVVLPSGVTGTLSLSGNNIIVTINSSTYPYFTPLAFTPATLCTNTTLSFTAGSLVTTITNVQVISQTTTLGGVTNIVTTNNIGSSGLSVTGLGTATANISYALAASTIYNSVTVRATDANGVNIFQTFGPFDTISPTLVIEASDFNFSNGQFIDTPQNGGVALYTNQVGVQGIDENKAARAGTKSYYRPNDAVIIQTATPNLGTPPSLTEQKFFMALNSGDTVDTEQEVGFNTPGDWLNYTRTFGPAGSAPAGTYNVWCYLATSGTGAQCSFSQLTSDPTQGNQTTNFIGTFGTAGFSDSGYNNYVYVPLVDQYGNRVALTVGSGQQTFKSTIVGNPNVAFYMLTPVAPVLTPQVLHVYPDGTASGQQATNAITFTVGPAQGAPLNSNGIHLVLNGTDVTAGLTYSQVGGVWTASFHIQSNLLYTAVIYATNTSGYSISYPLSFDTLDLKNFQWEAVDYDFSTNDGTAWHSGLFIDNPMPTGDTNAGSAGNPYVNANPYLAPNSYNWYPEGFTEFNDPYAFVGSVALQGVDINFTNASGMQYTYRNDTTTYLPSGGTQSAPVVGSQIASDTLNGGLRYQFLAAQTNTSDFAICEFNIGWFNTGDWLNYTRTYPSGKFNVWGRLAGGAGAFSGTTLSLVTSGVGTSNQTTQVLGSFADAVPAGWQTYHWVPMLDTNGNRAVISLGGKATLRLTSGNNLNPLFFMLTPALTTSFSISSTEAGGSLQINIPTSFGFNYTLWQSSSLTGGVWTQVGSSIPGDGLTHTVTQPATGGQSFYRVSAQ